MYRSFCEALAIVPLPQGLCVLLCRADSPGGSSMVGNAVAETSARRGPRPRSETTHLETLLQRLARDGEERFTALDKKVLLRTVKKEVQRRAKVRARARSRAPCVGGGAAPPPRATRGKNQSRDKTKERISIFFAQSQNIRYTLNPIPEYAKLH